MKKILVTGADGFIGSHLTEMLASQGHKVKALSMYNSFNYWGWLEDIEFTENIEVVSGDIRDLHFCREITKGVELIYHLASLIGIPYSYQAPESYVDTNIKGTVNICQAANDNKISRIIHTSTSEVYGTAQYVPIDEKHPLQAQSPYSASKIAADAMVMSYFNAFGLPVTIARPFNTYGPRQSARAIIPTIISQLSSGNEKVQLGDLTPTRDFTYVEDTCRGFLALSDSDETVGETINIGSNSEISIEELFILIKKLMGKDAEVLSDKKRIRPKKSEVFRLLCDNKKILSLTNFSPKISLEDGLKRTIDWFMNEDNLKLYKTDIYNV